MAEWVTVADAATAAGKSKRLIYNLIDENLLDVEESTDGKTINFHQLNKVLGERKRRGRPRLNTPK